MKSCSIRLGCPLDDAQARRGFHTKRDGASFGLAGDGRSIGTVDADGVALAAIQGLHQKLEQAQAENAALMNRLEAIEAQLAR